MKPIVSLLAVAGMLTAEVAFSQESGAHEITVTGALPKGDTTASVSYVIMDPTNNTLVGQIALPNAVQKNTEVSMTVKVTSASASYAIGTFDEKGFTPSNFLSVRNQSR